MGLSRLPSLAVTLGLSSPVGPPHPLSVMSKGIGAHHPPKGPALSLVPSGVPARSEPQFPHLSQSLFDLHL